MEKVNFSYATYEESSTRTHRGTLDSIQRFLDNGYHVQEARNGFFVLTKPARVIAVFKNSAGKVFHFNVKQDILDYYCRTRISQNLFEKFYADASEGKIIFFLDDCSVKFSKSDN